MPEHDIVPTDPTRDDVLAYGRELEIADLKDNRALTLLLDALRDAEAEMELMIGRNVLHSNKPVDQRQLDYTRGYYDGARYWLRGRIATAADRVAKYEAAQANPGGDPRPQAGADPRSEGVDRQ